MKYSIFIDAELELSQIQQTRCINKIVNTIDDKRGWKKLGYEFEYIPNTKRNIDFIIYMSSNEKIIKECDLYNLSCSVTPDNIIYLNYMNWKNNVKKTKLNTDQYRTMVVNHEVGHILGRSHYEFGKPNTKAPLMSTQTLLGCKNHKPNMYPLFWE
jgi:hypothetical protein